MVISKLNSVPNKLFSEAILDLLNKKIFANSKYFFSKQKPTTNFLREYALLNSSKKEIIKKLFTLIFLLVLFFVNIFKVSYGNKKKKLLLIYSLTFEQAIRNGSIKSLYNFLESRKLVSKLDVRILIEVRKIHLRKKFKTAKTTLDIPLAIYSDHFTLAEKINCFISMCKKFYKLVFEFKNYFYFAPILKEHIFDETVYATLNSKYIENLVTTQSQLAFQPLIFKYANLSVKKIMIWYSSNSVPAHYKKSNSKKQIVNPIVYTNLQIDEHWVWTKANKFYLTQFTDAKISVKKSLMFYNPGEPSISQDNYDVLIFDVIPYRSNSMTEASIYSTSEMIKFIEEVLLCVKEIRNKHQLNLSVGLKHKRKISNKHSSVYSRFVENKLLNNEIKIIKPEQNLYDIISKSQIVIGFPFTSPVIIGQELRVPSVYYCSSNLLKLLKKSKNNQFLQDRADLFRYIEKVVINKT